MENWYIYNIIPIILSCAWEEQFMWFFGWKKSPGLTVYRAEDIDFILETYWWSQKRNSFLYKMTLENIVVFSPKIYIIVSSYPLTSSYNWHMGTLQACD